jgi:two-component system nitrate/nitrite response regulator NarL
MRDLTPRQSECMSLLCEGKTVKVIAKALGLSPATVKNHLSDAYFRLGAHNKVQAALTFAGIRR